MKFLRNLFSWLRHRHPQASLDVEEGHVEDFEESEDFLDEFYCLYLKDGTTRCGFMDE